MSAIFMMMITSGPSPECEWKVLNISELEKMGNCQDCALQVSLPTLKGSDVMSLNTTNK